MAHGHQLYVIRHGLADARGERWPDDAKRPLTREGIARLRKSARALRGLGVDFDLILTSPLVRARQTAEILAEGQDLKAAVVVTAALAPGGTPAGVVKELGKHARERAIAMVGHEPGLGALASALIGVPQPIPFKKGAVCRIDVDSVAALGPGTLRWLLTPKVLGRLR